MNCSIRKAFCDFLSVKGLNMSRQRLVILEAFLSGDTRTSVDDLHHRLRSRHPMIGRTTVYRTMKLVAESGVARTYADGSAVLYERCRAKITY